MEPQQTQNQQPVHSGQPQPLYRGTIWYRPPGKKTNFSAQKSNIWLYPGLLIVTDFETNQEYFRTNLAPDTKFVHSLKSGVVRVKYSNGQKIGLFNAAYQFPFYNIVNVIGLLLIGAVTSLFIRFGSVVGLFALFIILPGLPRAKEFMRAAEHAVNGHHAGATHHSA